VAGVATAIVMLLRCGCCRALAIILISKAVAAAAFINQASTRILATSSSRSFGAAWLRSDAAAASDDNDTVQIVPPPDRFRHHTAQLCWYDRILLLNDGSAITSQVDLKFRKDEFNRLWHELRRAVECETNQLQLELSVLQEKIGHLDSATDEMSSGLKELNHKFGAVTGFLYSFALRGGIFRYDFFVFAKITFQLVRELEVFIDRAEPFIKNHQRRSEVAEVTANVKHLSVMCDDDVVDMKGVVRIIIDGEFSECSRDMLELYDHASETFGKQGQHVWALTNRVDYQINELNNLNYHAYEANRKLGTVLDLEQKFTDVNGKGPTARNAVAELTKHASAWEKAKKRRTERWGKRNSGNILLDFALKVKSLFLGERTE
jgi:hypothetical protein